MQRIYIKQNYLFCIKWRTICNCVWRGLCYRSTAANCVNRLHSQKTWFTAKLHSCSNIALQYAGFGKRAFTYINFKSFKQEYLTLIGQVFFFNFNFDICPGKLLPNFDLRASNHKLLSWHNFVCLGYFFQLWYFYPGWL